MEGKERLGGFGRGSRISDTKPEPAAPGQPAQNGSSVPSAASFGRGFNNDFKPSGFAAMAAGSGPDSRYPAGQPPTRAGGGSAVGGGANESDPQSGRGGFGQQRGFGAFNKENDQQSNNRAGFGQQQRGFGAIEKENDQQASRGAFGQPRGFGAVAAGGNDQQSGRNGFGQQNSGFGNTSKGFGQQDAPRGGFGQKPSFGVGENDVKPAGRGFGGGERSQGGDGCRSCGEMGHFARECPNKPAGGGDRACRNCGEEGHFARECPSKKPGGGGGGDNTCRSCGEVGHFARECPQAGANGEVKPPASSHIPAKLATDEASLFALQEHVPHVEFSRYADEKITLDGGEGIQLISSFESAGLHPLVLTNIKKMAYEHPTPIQRAAFSVIGANRDLMARAETGSGKTLAFIGPVVSQLLSTISPADYPVPGREQHPLVLIVAPTRELSKQIFEECAVQIIHGSPLLAVNVYGGTQVRYQMDEVKEGCSILIGTPGRIKDFCGKGLISLDKLRYFILDEADRMLDMQMEEELRVIMMKGGMPPKGERRTLMFSATFTPDVQNLAREFLHNHVVAEVGNTENKDVVQEILLVPERERNDKLVELLRKDLESDGAKIGDRWTKKTVVFVRRKRTADFLAVLLCQKNLPATSIHGDRQQSEREEATNDLKMGKYPILLASDVFARGMDVYQLDHVINYELSTEKNVYIHRIGRTGRIGRRGTATTFFDPASSDDMKMLPEILAALGNTGQDVPKWLLDLNNPGGAYAFGNDYTANSGGFAKPQVEEEW